MRATAAEQTQSGTIVLLALASWAVPGAGHGAVYTLRTLEDSGWLLYRTAGTQNPPQGPPASVPEPGTFALFGAAFAAMGFMRRRQLA